MLDEFMKIAEDDGFYVKDYGVGMDKDFRS